MHQALIVARMAPGSAPDIAKVFEGSDRGELPQDPAPAIAKVAGHPEFRAISKQLSAYVTAYDPATWRSPKDAMAHCFYRWERDAAV